VKRDHSPNASAVRQNLRFGRDLDFGTFEPRGERVQSRGIRNFPTEETSSLRQSPVDYDPLLAVVHSERQQRGAALHRLQSHEARSEVSPVLDLVRAETSISESLYCHRARSRFLG
jgi:hypothetical protein